MKIWIVSWLGCGNYSREGKLFAEIRYVHLQGTIHFLFHIDFYDKILSILYPLVQGPLKMSLASYSTEHTWPYLINSNGYNFIKYKIRSFKWPGSKWMSMRKEMEEWRARHNFTKLTFSRLFNRWLMKNIHSE